MRRPSVIYAFAPNPFWFHMRKFCFLFSQCALFPFDRIQTKPPDLEVRLTARQGVSVSPAGVGDPAVLLHGGLVETVQEERSAFSRGLLSPIGRERALSHSTENPIYVFPEMNLQGLIPNSYIHVSVSNLHIPRPIWLQQNRQPDPGNIWIIYRYIVPLTELSAN